MTYQLLTKNRRRWVGVYLWLLMCSLSLNASGQEDIHIIDANHWLMSERGAGLSLVNSSGEVLQRLQGAYSAIDSRELEMSHTLVSVVQQKSNQLELFIFDGEELRLHNTLSVDVAKLESACLYHDRPSQVVDVFLILEDAGVQHYRLYDVLRHVWINEKIRSLPVGTGLVDCDVDDPAAKVFFAQENQGVWEMDAHAEGAIEARAVAMHEPFGAIRSEIKKVVALSGGELLLSQPDLNGILRISSFGGRTSLDVYPIATELEVFALDFIDEQAGKINLVYFDGRLRRVSLPFKTSPMDSQVADYQYVAPVLETQPVAHFGDAADDPAIWVNPRKADKSLILGTDKQGGLGVYNLDGEQIQFLATGRLNNVDVKTLTYGEKQTYHLVAASNRDNNTIALFEIDPKKRRLRFINEIPTDLDEVYGLCMYAHQVNQQYYVFINDKDGRYTQYQLSPVNKSWQADKVRSFSMTDQPEGCAADEVTGKVFIGVEELGIWTLDADHTHAENLQQILSVGEFNLKDDIEGLAIYQSERHRLLVVSSQGNGSYALFHADSPFNYVGSFKVIANQAAGIDGSSQTDGLEVTAQPLGAKFPRGMLVVQDGRNVMPVERQNFKLVSMEEVLAGFESALTNSDQ